MQDSNEKSVLQFSTCYDMFAALAASGYCTEMSLECTRVVTLLPQSLLHTSPLTRWWFPRFVFLP